MAKWKIVTDEDEEIDDVEPGKIDPSKKVKHIERYVNGITYRIPMVKYLSNVYVKSSASSVVSMAGSTKTTVITERIVGVHLIPVKDKFYLATISSPKTKVYQLNIDERDVEPDIADKTAKIIRPNTGKYHRIEIKTNPKDDKFIIGVDAAETLTKDGFGK